MEDEDDRREYHEGLTGPKKFCRKCGHEITFVEYTDHYNEWTGKPVRQIKSMCVYCEGKP